MKKEKQETNQLIIDNTSSNARHSKDWLKHYPQGFLAHKYPIVGWHECGIDLLVWPQNFNSLLFCVEEDPSKDKVTFGENLKFDLAIVVSCHSLLECRGLDLGFFMLFFKEV